MLFLSDSCLKGRCGNVQARNILLPPGSSTMGNELDNNNIYLCVRIYVHVYAYTIVCIYPYMQTIICKVIFPCIFQTKAMIFKYQHATVCLRVDFKQLLCLSYSALLKHHSFFQCSFNHPSAKKWRKTNSTLIPVAQKNTQPLKCMENLSSPYPYYWVIWDSSRR